MRPLLGILFLALVTAASADDFRGLSWGSSKEQIKTAETWELVEERQDGLLYQGTVAGLNALAYYFILPETDQLAAARYVFVDKYGEGFAKDTYEDRRYTADDFRSLAALLEQKYGTPKVAASTSVLRAEWQLNDSQIVLQRHENKDDFFNTIEYRSEQLGDQWDAWIRSQNPL